MLIEIKTNSCSQWVDIKHILYFNSYIKSIGFIPETQLKTISYVSNYEELLIQWKTWNNRKI